MLTAYHLGLFWDLGFGIFMFVLGINGSPRIGGNTDLLLEEALRGARSRGARTEKIVLNSLNYSPCQECERANYDSPCIVQDDMHLIYARVRDADAIVLGSPTFFGSLSAQTKMMVDRFQCAWFSKKKRGRDFFSREKSCAFIAVQASLQQENFAAARAVVRNLCATINGVYRDELFCPGLDEKGSSMKHPEFMQRAFDLGERITAVTSY